jgi:isochorismate pyruvate lyase
MGELIKTPESCANMVEIREAVSKIDRQIVALLGTRLRYVHAAVRFKPDEESIRRPDHWDQFFAVRKAWAEQEGYPAAVIEALYKTLYDYTVETQLALHKKKRAR